MLEEGRVSQVIYDGGNMAGVLLLKKCGSLQNFMVIFDFLIPEWGWKQAFQKHFKLTEEGFYLELEKFVAETHVPIARSCEKKVSVGFW